MLREELTLKLFRFIYLPISFLVEITLTILFLVLKFYSNETADILPGYLVYWGWILASSCLLIAIGLVIIFLSSFKFKNEQSFLYKEKPIEFIIYLLVFLSLARIALIATSLLFYIPFSPEKTAAYLLILALSIFPPLLLYYQANHNKKSEKVYSLSKEAPISIKVSAFWFLFIAGAMQIFSTEPVILIMALVFLLTSYFFFNLYPLAVSVTPILLLVHSAASIFFSVIIFTNLTNQDILAGYTPIEAIIVTTFFFTIPAVISLALTITFFRKKITNWVKEIQPKEDLELYYADEEDEILSEE